MRAIITKLMVEGVRYTCDVYPVCQSIAIVTTALAPFFPRSVDEKKSLRVSM
jgi:hypothetical protein